jgi:NAD-dependent DNA ligase/predicted flap endonuclease-1-like 5' DNA nuclease
MSKTLKKPIAIKTSQGNKTLKLSHTAEKLKKNSLTPENIETKPMSKSKRYNEEFIELLDELAQLMIKKGEPFRSRAYKKAEEAIIKFPDDINTISQLKDIPGIGTTILTKLEEYIKTGKVSVLERERNDPANILAGIYGIGPKKAKELVEAGITTIAQLENKPGIDMLNDKQKLGVKYYQDIQKRIPREEIVEFGELFKQLFDKVAPKNSDFEIVGSFRRGAKTSGDIDIIITNNDNNREAFDKVLDLLIKDKIITEVLSRGKTKSLTLVQIKKDGPIRRVDFLYTPPDEYAFALFYFTGSKLFNTIVRQQALDLGYTLNEHGFSNMNKGVKGKKVDKYFPTEASILNFLGFEYVKPENRVDGRQLKPFKEPTPKEESDEELLKALENLETEVKEPLLFGDQSKESVVPVESEDDDEDISDEALLKALESSPKVKKEMMKKNKTLKKPTELFPSATKMIENFKAKGISVLKTMTEKQLTELIKLANTKYYCDEDPVFTDSEYDVIREYILEKYPHNKEAKAGHTQCVIENSKTKVKLPYELWSMDKIKPTTDAVTKWTKKYKGPYVISAKLDGISALYVNNKDGVKMYTRGNGIYGQDISHLIPYLVKKDYKNIAIRGEIIISKENFDEYYKKDFANPRNFVAGIVNKKKVDKDILKHLDFVAYEVISPEMKPFQQMLDLGAKEIKHVKFDVKKEISNEILSEILLKWRDDYEYEIDGIIVVNDEIYPRPKGNPEYAFAFKMVISDQVAEVKVVDIIWTPSKDGYLVPRVQIEPIVLGGVKIEYATGFNAKFIEENNIGVGAVISIIRSGDVIPHILGTVVPASKPLMPTEEYEWDSTHTNILVVDKDNPIVKEKNILGFFKNIEVDGLGPGNIKKIIEAGFDTVPKILAMTKADFLKVPGFKTKTTDKLYDGIHSKLEKATLYELMTASNSFGRGFGDKRFESILDMYPDILVAKESDKEKIAKLVKVEGVAKKTAEKFVEHIPDFTKFMKDAKLDGKLSLTITKPSEIDKSHLLYGKKIVMTGFRDKDLIQKLKDIGADNNASVSKNTFVVLVKKDKDEVTGKAEEARKLDIPIMTRDEFINKYL